MPQASNIEWKQVRYDLGPVTTVEITGETRFLLSSDRHIDSPLSDLNMQRRHLDEMMESGAHLLDFGDLLDAMQGREDKRRSRAELLDSLNREGYYDRLVDKAVGFLAPYASRIIMLCEGNHESSVGRHADTLLMSRIIDRLNRDHGGRIAFGEYDGWVRFVALEDGHRRATSDLYYHHGSGGGGAVTQGMIQAQRRQHDVRADIYLAGHIHTSYRSRRQVRYLTRQGIPEEDGVLHIQLPSYKGRGQWDRERSTAAMPKGASWLRLRWTRETAGRRPYRLLATEEEAI